MIYLRKCITLLLCFCMGMYAVPSLASSSQVSEDEAVKLELLSDVEMASIVGANGNVDASLSDYKVVGGVAKAVFANRSTLHCTYSLDATDANGNVLEVLQSGTLEPGEAIVASGTPTVANANTIVARILNEGVPGLQSRDFSMLQ